MSDIFSKKNLKPEWPKLEELGTVKDMLEKDENMEQVLESLYPTLVNLSLSQSDGDLTVDKLVRLFELTQHAMELKNMYLEEAETQITDLEMRLSDKTSELTRAQRNASPSGTRSPDRDGYGFDIRGLNDRIADLERRNEALTRSLTKTEDTLAQERRVVALATTNLKEEKNKNITLEETNKHLSEMVQDLESQIVLQKDRISAVGQDEEKYKTMIKEKNSDIDKYLTEVQMLSTDNAAMRQENENLNIELEAAITELDKTQIEVAEKQAILEKNIIVMDALQDEKDALSLQLEEMSDQLRKQDGQSRFYLDKLRGHELKQLNEVQKSEYDLMEKDSLISRLKSEVVALKEQVQLNDSGDLQRILIEKEERIEELMIQLEDSRTDFAILSEDWAELKDALQRNQQVIIQANMNEAAVINEDDRIKRLQEKLSAVKDEAQQRAMDSKRLDKAMVSKEKEIMDLRQHLEKFENGSFGLKDALTENKYIKDQLKIRTEELQVHVKKLNEIEFQLTELIDENEELRNRLGIKHTKVDVTKLQSNRQVDFEKAKSLNITLKREIERLEEERLEMKAKLRLQALDRGKQAVELGLSIEDLIALETYATHLRLGDTAPTGKPPSTSNERLNRITSQLERIQSDGNIQITGLNENLSESYNRISYLESALCEVSSNFATALGGQQKDWISLHFPAVEKLMSYLKCHDHNSNHLSKAGQGEEGIIQMNESLAKKIAASTQEVDHLRGRIKELEEQQGASLTKHFDIPRDIAVGTIIDYSVVVNMWISAVTELEQKSNELTDYHNIVKAANDKYAMLAGKQQLLYDDLARGQKTHIDKVSHLEKQILELQQEKTFFEKEYSALEVTLKQISSGSEQLSIIFDLNSRCYLAEWEAFRQQRRASSVLYESELKANFSEAEISDLKKLCEQMKESIVQHSNQEESLSQKVLSLTQRIENSVDLLDYEILEKRYLLQSSKLHQAQSHEQDWIEAKSQSSDLLEKLKAAEKSLEVANDQVMMANSRAKEYENENRKLSASLKSSYGHGNASLQREEIANLKSQLQIFQSRSELALQKFEAEQSCSSALNARIQYLESRCIEIESLAIRDQETSLQNIEDLTLEIKTMKNHVESTNSKALEAKHALHEQKNMANSAYAQVVDISIGKELMREEIALLKANILELQSDSDNILLIGNLHACIRDFKLRETSTLMKLNKLDETCKTLERIKIQNEIKLSEKDEEWFKLSSNFKSRTKFLRKSLFEFHQRSAALVTTYKYDKVCSLNNELNEKIQDWEGKFHAMEDKAELLQVEIDEIRIRKDLDQDVLQSLHQKGGQIAIKLAEWRDKLSKSQLSELKLKRQLGTLREIHESTKLSLLEAQREVSGLEVDLDVLRNEHTEALLDWENRQSELETLLEAHDLEKQRVFASASTSALKHIMPDKSLSIGAQLEQSLLLLLERSTVLDNQKDYIATMERDLLTQKADLDTSKQIITKLESEIMELKIAQAEMKMDRHDSYPEFVANPIELDIQMHELKKFAQLFQKRESETLRVAQEAVASMNRQLKSKDEMLEKYRDLLKSVREEATNEAQMKKASSVDTLVVADMRHETQLKNLRVPSESLLRIEFEHKAAIQELHELLRLKEEELVSTRHQREVLEDKLFLEKDFSNKAREESEAKEKDLNHQIQNLKQIIEDTNERVALMETELERRPDSDSNYAEKLEELQTALQRRKAKEVQYKLSVDDLKRSLEAAQEKIQSHAEKIREIQRAKSAVAESEKIKELEQKNMKLSRSLEKVKKDESYHLQAVMTLQDDKGKIEKEIFKADEEKIHLQQLLKGYRSQIKKLTTELDHFRSLSGQETSTQVPIDNATLEKERDPRLIEGIKAEFTKEKWELEKRAEKKIESLRTKLSAKVQEAEELLKTRQNLKDLLARTEKEKARLNIKLQNALLSPQEVRNELQSIKHENAELKKKMAESEAAAAATNRPSAQKFIQVVEDENIKLRKQVAKEVERSKTFQTRMKDLDMAKEQLMQQLVELKTALDHRTNSADAQDLKDQMKILQDKNRELETELKEQKRLVSSGLGLDYNPDSRLKAENRKLLRELETWKLRASKLTDQAMSSASSRLNQSINPATKDNVVMPQIKERLDVLEQENVELKAQIKQADTKFNETLEDMNHNYKEAVRLNVRYEEAIRELGARAHVNVESLLGNDSSSQHSH